MIERDPGGAARERFDLLVVGGGIYGVALALESARRGQRPLLVERGDFGAETSWNSLRIIHGGLRYLRSLDLRRHRESIRDRAWLLRHFPDLVHPLPCLMPLYGDGLRRPGPFRAALATDRLLSRGVEPALPAGRVLSAAETAALFPAVEKRHLLGGGLWHDAAAPDSQRLIAEMLRWMATAGGQALNYVEATGLLTAEGRVAGVSARDLASGEELELRAPLVVNCAGPWARELAARFDRDHPRLFRPAIAFNLLLDRAPLSEAALAVAPPGRGRSYFLYPWKEKILAGTFHATWSGPLSQGAVAEELVGELIGELNRALPAFALRPEEVLRVHWGFLPARSEGSSVPADRDVILDHGRQGGPEGLISVSGVKFTTAPTAALKTLRRIAGRRGERLAEPSGPGRPEPAAWPERAELEALLERDPAEAARRVRELARREAVLKIGDLLLRRTDWGIDPRRERVLAERLGPMLEEESAAAPAGESPP